MEYPLIARLNELNTSMSEIREELITIFCEVNQLRTNPRRELSEPIWIIRRLNQLASRVKELNIHIDANIMEAEIVNNVLNRIRRGD